MTQENDDMAFAYQEQWEAHKTRMAVDDGIITYMATVTTLYRVHAKDKPQAIAVIQDKVRGGVFHDNIVIVDQQALIYQGTRTNDPTMLEPQQFRLGNEQLG
jgi:hypothetical protein